MQNTSTAPAIYSVYKHTAPSGKVYVGITSQSPRRRWKNGEGYKKCPAFYNAILKYGWDNIKHEILFDGINEKTAFELEKKYISLYKSTNRKYGYNLSIGGEKGALGAVRSEETKEKIRKALTGVPHTEERRGKNSQGHIGLKASEETKKAISERLIGNKHRCGIAHTKETKARIREIARSKPNCRKILCKETGTVYESAANCTERTGINSGSISACCRGIRPSAGGLHWEYAEVS